MLACIEKSKICGTIFSRVCTKSNFGLFTFVCLRHRSSAYRDLHTSPVGSGGDTCPCPFLVQQILLVAKSEKGGGFGEVL